MENESAFNCLQRILLNSHLFVQLENKAATILQAAFYSEISKPFRQGIIALITIANDSIVSAFYQQSSKNATWLCSKAIFLSQKSTVMHEGNKLHIHGWDILKEESNELSIQFVTAELAVVFAQQFRQCSDSTDRFVPRPRQLKQLKQMFGQVPVVVTMENLQNSVQPPTAINNKMQLSNSVVLHTSKTFWKQSLPSLLDVDNGSRVLSRSQKNLTSSVDNNISSICWTMLNGQDIINDSASANLQHIIQDLLKKREPNYCKYSNIRLFIGTWNVNGRFDDALAIEKWLMQGVTSENELPDIYALGFQELEITWGGMAFNKASSSSLEERWINLIERSQPFTKTNYYRIQRCRMAAIFVVVYVRASLRKHIKDDSIIISSLPTGLMNVVGNKGATAIRFQLFDDQLCFVNVHMAAGENNVVRRNQDYLDISSRLVFNKAPNPPSLIENHDIIFIFGDMNYRIAQLESATVKKHIDKSQIQELLTFDELGRQKQEERIFQNFQEAGITFRPTYKFDAMTNTYDSSDKNRIPSFCDRVLWKCDRAENVVYTSVEALMISDHKPVVAYFNLKVKQIDATLYRSTYESVIREIDTAQNAILPQATLSTHDLDFGEIHLMEAKQASLVITNTGKYAFSYDFKGKNDTDPKLPEWITIAKGNKRVAPGESETLTLEVYVNPKFVRKFHTGDYTFDDILILDLQNGKDFFLTTHGRLAPTSFGLPLSVLLSLNVPICDVNAQELLNKVKKSITQIPSVRQPSVFGKDGAFVVPKEIFRLADHIYLHGLQQEELFRQPGVHLETQSLRQALDNGSIHDALPKVSVHSVMETLMTFVESMYDTIIPKQFYDICIESSGDRQKSIEALRKLPVDHRNLFIYITSLLHEIIINSQHNGVEYGMIAEVFGDIVFRDCPHRYKKGKAIKEFMTTFLI